MMRSTGERKRYSKQKRADTSCHSVLAHPADKDEIGDDERVPERFTMASNTAAIARENCGIKTIKP